jgi:ABC-2 type transport system ATP-binding protein
MNTEGALEVDVTKGQGLNPLFAELEKQAIKVLSMRTKANRLEELFVRMVEDNARENAKGEDSP